MNIFDFMSASPWLTWCLAWLVWPTLWVAYLVSFFVANAWTRLLRVISVICRGWPPTHLDADGDWRPRPKAAE